MTPGGGAPRDGEDGFLAARERARQRAASGQIGAGERALPLSRLASTHYADEDEDGGFLAGRKSERTRLTPAGALASDSSYDPAPPPRGGSASHRVSSQRMVEIEMNEGPSADTPSSASTGAYVRQPLWARVAPLASTTDRQLRNNAGARRARPSWVATADSGEYEGEHTTCCGCSSGLFVFWRFALALSVLLSLADTASDISVIVLLARDENWTGFGMTLGESARGTHRARCSHCVRSLAVRRSCEPARAMGACPAARVLEPPLRRLADTPGAHACTLLIPRLHCRPELRHWLL